MPLAEDLHLSPEEKRKHKKKCLVQSPNSYFMDVRCPGCYKITTIFSHVQHSRFVCWLLNCPLPACRRKSKAFRRVLLQAEAAL
ncbi:unnamed protein product, partial [Rangifer tarandus platyrhynchus]